MATSRPDRVGVTGVEGFAETAREDDRAVVPVAEGVVSELPRLDDAYVRIGQSPTTRPTGVERDSGATDPGGPGRRED
ncbi:MAG: hypothetical protein V5A28_07700 [Haloarculaceae archaeon]